MWTDSEDLSIIADLYQMKIKVVTTKGSTDTNPTVNWIHPDPELKEFAELKDTKVDDLVLLHENDTHFNLVVSNQSDLAIYGSLSFRFNVGPIMEDLSKTDSDIETNSSEDIENVAEDASLKKQLKECQKAKQMMEKEYYKCQAELSSKTEECEKLKIVIKDLKQYKELKDITGGINDKVNEEQFENEDEEHPWITIDKPKSSNKKNRQLLRNVAKSALN